MAHIGNALHHKNDKIVFLLNSCNGEHMMWDVTSPTSKYFHVISNIVHVKQKSLCDDFLFIYFLFYAHCGSYRIRYGSLEVTNLIPFTTIVRPCFDEVASINVTLVSFFPIIDNMLYIFFSLFSCQSSTVTSLKINFWSLHLIYYYVVHLGKCNMLVNF